jgi:hypothetical protein
VLSFNKDYPLIPKPNSRKSVGPHSNIAEKYHKDNAVSCKSLNMGELGRIRVNKVEPPKDKKFRTVDFKDKNLLQFLEVRV